MKCRNCNLPVYPGNSRVVGKGKRKREHIDCQKAAEFHACSGSEVARPPEQQTSEPQEENQASLNERKKLTGIKVGPMKVESEKTDTGMKITVSQRVEPMFVNDERGVSSYNASEPGKNQASLSDYRFFLHPSSVEKLKKSIHQGEAWLWGFASNWGMGIQIQVIPVLSEVVEAEPDRFEDYTEIKLEGEG